MSQNAPTPSDRTLIKTVLLMVVAGGGAMAYWFGASATDDLVLREPTPRQLAIGAKPGNIRPEEVRIGEFFKASNGTPGALAGTWPMFRGADSRNIALAKGLLSNSWPQGGPPKIWSLELGEGYAGAAVREGRVYVLDYDEEEKADALRCLSVDTGKEIWRRWYKVRVKRNHGRSRTVPAVSGKHVVTMGPRCHVMCVDRVTGDFRWGLDLVKAFGSKEPLWYTGQCPLIDKEVAVIAPAGKNVLLMGVDCATGEILWQTPNPNAWNMSHACVMPMTFGGVRMYVYAALGGMVGVAADGENRGAVLWETSAWDHSVIAPSPVQIEEDRIFVTSGHGAGSMMFRVSQQRGGFQVVEEQRWSRKVFACEQQTPLYFQGHLFSVLPKDSGALKMQLVCLTPTGEMIWSSGKANRFGLGPFMIADNKLLVLKDNGILVMLEASTRQYNELARARVLGGKEAWAPMALVGSRLIVRDSRQMVCLELGQP